MTAYFGFYFSPNHSANSYTIHVEMQADNETVKMAPRYANAEPSVLHEAVLNADELRSFGELCIAIASTMARGE